MAVEVPLPKCPTCQNPINPKTDVLWDNTGHPVVGLKGVNIVYCGFCGAIFGAATITTLTKKRRG